MKRSLRFFLLFFFLLCFVSAALAADISFDGGIRFGDPVSILAQKATWKQAVTEASGSSLAYCGEFARIPETTALYYPGDGTHLSEVILSLCNNTGAVPGSLDEDTADLCYRLVFNAFEKLYGSPDTSGKGRLDPPGDSGAGSGNAHDAYDEVIAVAKSLADSGYSKKVRLPVFDYHRYAVWNVSTEQGTVNIQLETVSKTSSKGYVSYGTNVYFWLEK